MILGDHLVAGDGLLTSNNISAKAQQLVPDQMRHLGTLYTYNTNSGIRHELYGGAAA